MSPEPRSPRATIIMTTRERHALTEVAIESIVANTKCPYRFIYADVQSPDWLRDRLEKRSKEWNLEVIRLDEDLWPNQVRRRLAGLIDTEYVVYIDNDVLVEMGWLEALMACADETGAGVVGPLYLWGDGKRSPKIHMAGGKLTELRTAQGTVLEEAHQLVNEDPVEAAHKLIRQPCDFAEYHCMLIRAELVHDGELFDQDILCVHEHIDTSLTARQRGYATFVEPNARVTYLAFADHMLDDIPFLRKRWARETGEASISAFAKKWHIANDNRSFGRLRHFLHLHLSNLDPVRPSSLANSDHAVPMQRHELAQSRSDLFDLALSRGYGQEELLLLARAYQLAMFWADGGYRPCGRPFINHLVGTASVLMRYDFRVEVVAAGLLHAAYTHGPQLKTGPQTSIDSICTVLGGRGTALEKRVRAYTQRGKNLQALIAASEAAQGLSVLGGETVAIAAANEIDMALSGEFRYSGRPDAATPSAVELMSRVCRILGVPGLTETLRLAAARRAPAPAELATKLAASYRIAGQSIVPMTHNDFFVAARDADQSPEK
jgi:GT2 family glycosyltransferase